MVIGIVGAGIGGLTTAIALQKLGITFKLFERAPKIEAVGAGLSLAPNGMEIMRKLDLFDAVSAVGIQWKHYHITDEQFKTLQKIPPTFYRNKETVGLSIGRPELHHILFEKLPSEYVYLDHELNQIEKEGNQIVLRFNNQTEHKVDILIGADGLNSFVRKHIFPDSEIRSAQQICWRGLHPTQNQNPDIALEAWGRGARFGVAQMSKEWDYWYVVIDSEEMPTKWTQADIAQQVKNFNPVAKSMITNTSIDKIILHPIVELKPLKQWYKGKIVLIGDAAHAMTPNMGQGACQAIIDAWELANIIANQQDFSVYQSVRKPIVDKIFTMSRWVGQIAQWKLKPLVVSRNVMMRLTQPIMERIKI